MRSIKEYLTYLRHWVVAELAGTGKRCGVASIALQILQQDSHANMASFAVV
jgi:hypothetical protein